LARADEDSDRAAIRKVITTFNNERLRETVLGPHADVPDFSGCHEPEVSPVLFQPTRIRFVTPDVAFADAAASRYGTIGKRSVSSVFVLKREGAEWKIDALRVLDTCARIVLLGVKP
jgi:hypothetical protein